MTSRAFFTLALIAALGFGASRAAQSTPLLADNYLFLAGAPHSRTYDFNITASGVYRVTLVDTHVIVPFADLGVELDLLPPAGGSSLVDILNAPGSFLFDVLDSDLGQYEAIVNGTAGPGNIPGYPAFSTFGITIEAVPGLVPQADEVPEPRTLLLALLGLGALGAQRRHKRAPARTLA